MSPHLVEGAAAPDFSLISNEGKLVTLSSFKGRRAVVLFFYPKDDTPGCTKESCDFRDAYNAFLKARAIILGVSADSLKSHQKFREKFKLPFLLLSDESKSMLKSYGVWTKKKFMGREYMGITRTTVLIDRQGVVRRIFNQVKVKGHAEEVLLALKSLQ